MARAVQLLIKLTVSYKMKRIASYSLDGAESAVKSEFYYTCILLYSEQRILGAYQLRILVHLQKALCLYYPFENRSTDFRRPIGYNPK